MLKDMFNKKRLRINRDKVAKNIINYHFFIHCAQEIIERIQIIDKEFTTILDVSCRTGHLTHLLKKHYHNANIVATDISLMMLQEVKCDYKIQVDEDQLDINHPYLDSKFDLITMSSGLHLVNDIQSFLIKVYTLLKPGGIFVANFIGGNSLKNLRRKFIHIEDQLSIPHSNHLLPFIHFDHVTPLLQQCKFKEIIVDYENISLEYSSPLALMQTIKDGGESNVLSEKSNIPKAMLKILNDNSLIFYDDINLITCTASNIKNAIKMSI